MSSTKTTPVQGTHMLVALVDADGNYAGHETHLIGCRCPRRRRDGMKPSGPGMAIQSCHPDWIARSVDAPCLVA